MQKSTYKEMVALRGNADTSTGSTERSLLKCMAYFDVFEYPVLLKEMQQFMDQPAADEALGRALESLVHQGIIFRFNDLYSLRNNPLLCTKRLQGNQRAEALLPKAMKIGRFLCKFPYVMGIGISGSLSKNYADEHGDIDFFIITRANRLWIARTLMHLFKKFTYLTRSQHYYCMNYYVDETALQVEHRNIFTAMEVKTLVPAGGRESMETFFALNDWTNRFLPACPFPHPAETAQSYNAVRKFIERLFNNRMGERLDNWLLNKTASRWKAKKNKGKRNIKGHTMDLVTGKHFAWSNPDSFQEKVLFKYNQKLQALKLQAPRYFEDLLQISPDEMAPPARSTLFL